MELIFKVDFRYHNVNSENRGIKVNHNESIHDLKQKKSFTK